MISFIWFVSAFLGLMVLALVVYAILILQVGRSTLDLAQWDQPVLDRTDARYWKLGFYLNPQDPAIVVPKRNPNFGTTFNIGHAKGRLFAAGLFLGVALLIVLIGVLPLLALR